LTSILLMDAAENGSPRSRLIMPRSTHWAKCKQRSRWPATAKDTVMHTIDDRPWD